MSPRRTVTGHTLVELLCTLAVAATLAAAAAPSLAGFLLDARRDAAVRTLLHAVHAARQIAASYGEQTVLCGLGADGACVPDRDWTAGLLVASGGAGPRRALPFASRGPRLRSNREEIRFAPGTRHVTPATLVFCDRRGSGAARAVLLSRSGRARLSDAAADGRPLPC